MFVRKEIYSYYIKSKTFLSTENLWLLLCNKIFKQKTLLSDMKFYLLRLMLLFILSTYWCLSKWEILTSKSVTMSKTTSKNVEQKAEKDVQHKRSRMQPWKNCSLWTVLLFWRWLKDLYTQPDGLFTLKLSGF